MSNFVPDRATHNALSPIDEVRLARGKRRSDLEVARYELRAWIESQKDQIDTYALADAIRCATEEERRFFYNEIRRADSDVTRTLVIRKLAKFADLNDARIERRFGR